MTDVDTLTITLVLSDCLRNTSDKDMILTPSQTLRRRHNDTYIIQRYLETFLLCRTFYSFTSTPHPMTNYYIILYTFIVLLVSRPVAKAAINIMLWVFVHDVMNLPAYKGPLRTKGRNYHFLLSFIESCPRGCHINCTHYPICHFHGTDQVLFLLAE